jgi:hypothetical protein
MELDWTKMSDDQEIGYIVECDLEYPESLHEAHSSFPLAPEHLDINEEMLSAYAKECHRVLNGKPKYSSKKLCATFTNRKKYVVHYMCLKTYLQMGMKLKKVRRVITFKQSDYLKKYVDHCTTLRINAESDFGKRLWKLYAVR